MEKVFVYGTLRQGEQYHDLLGDSRLFSLLALAKGTLADTGSGYPVLLETEGTVAGELYEVTAEVLQRLDELEEYYGPGDPRNDYERVVTEVTTDTGVTEAWIYVYRHTHQQYAAIPEGDWKLYRLKANGELLYFAYGSCMDLRRIQLAGREEDFSSVEGCGVAEGFQVAFTLPLADGGRADLVETSGKRKVRCTGSHRSVWLIICMCGKVWRKAYTALLSCRCSLRTGRPMQR